MIIFIAEKYRTLAQSQKKKKVNKNGSNYK